MRNSFNMLSDCIQFFAPFNYLVGLLLSAGVGDVKENSQKKAKLDGKK